MDSPRILILYISTSSGHHHAALAIEKAIRSLRRDCEVRTLDAVHYINPLINRLVNRVYMNIVKKHPEVWGYLYDNPDIVRSTKEMRGFIHRTNFPKLDKLMSEFRPTAIACTQAFPCGMIAEWRRNAKINNIRLVGVLTDYAPHSYWMIKDVDIFILPSEETKGPFTNNGIPEEQLRVLGIPVAPIFAERGLLTRDYMRGNFRPQILLMGGGQGLGPMLQLVEALDVMQEDFDITVITGINKRLLNRLRHYEKCKGARRGIRVYGYIADVSSFMRQADLLVTKPGGMTTSEAISSGLPMLILNPIPGQEEMNARFLLRAGCAVKTMTVKETCVVLRELINSPVRLELMHRAAQRVAHPDSALRIAELLLS